jgi:hypothetical protein
MSTISIRAKLCVNMDTSILVLPHKFIDFIHLYVAKVNKYLRLCIESPLNTITYYIYCRDRLGRDRMAVMSSNPVHGDVYSIQHYVINISDLRLVCGFLRVFRFPLSIKLTATI